jgi:hypothetical protein
LSGADTLFQDSTQVLNLPFAFFRPCAQNFNDFSPFQVCSRF